MRWINGLPSWPARAPQVRQAVRIGERLRLSLKALVEARGMWLRAAASVSDREFEVLECRPLTPWPALCWPRKTSPASFETVVADAGLKAFTPAQLRALAEPLRVQAHWMALRRQRLCEDGVKVWLYDPDFVNWIYRVDGERVRCWALKYLSGYSRTDSLDETKVRLCLSRPMPLEVLWAYNLSRVGVLSGLTRDRPDAEVVFEYVSLFNAVHDCRNWLALGAEPCTQHSDYDHFYLTRVHGQQLSPGGLHAVAVSKFVLRREFDQHNLPSAVLEQAESFVTTALARARSGDSTPTGQPRSSFGPTCALCRLQPPPVIDCITHPPYQAGCTCEITFDVEFDTKTEAPHSFELAAWAAFATGRLAKATWAPQNIPARRLLFSLAAGC
jgi:hypothetical protein